MQRYRKEAWLLYSVGSLLKVASILVAFYLVLNFADNRFVLSGSLKAFFWTGSAAVLILASFLTFWRGKTEVSEMLQKYYEENPNWLPFAPAIMEDILSGKLSPRENEFTEEAMYEAKAGLRANGGSLLAHAGIVPSMRLFISEKILYSFSVLAFCFLAQPFAGLDPFLLATAHPDRTLRADYYELKPKSCKYFYGQKFEITFQAKNPVLRFARLEVFDSDREEFANAARNPDFQSKVAEGRQVFFYSGAARTVRFRVAAYLGQKLLFTDTRKVDFVFPTEFQEVRFRITPPAYTGIRPYDSTEPMLRAFYGSKVYVRVKLSKRDRLFLNTSELHSGSNVFESRFVFASLLPRKIRFKILSEQDGQTTESSSPLYEIYPEKDAAPEVSILTRGERAIRLPEKGMVHLRYRVFDDFGVRKAAVFAESEGQLVLLSGIKLHRKKAKTGVAYEGEVSADLRKVRGKQIRLFIAAQDNSLIPGTFPLSERSARGQVRKSNYVSIVFPASPDKVKKVREELFARTLEDLQDLATRYEESEKELKSILQRRAVNDDKSESEEELRKWLQERKLLKDSLQKVQNDVRQNFPESSDREEELKRKSLENLSKTLQEKIREREKELEKLLKKFPRDFEQAEQKIANVTKKEYLRNLENSIRMLKKLLALKKIRELKQEVSEERKKVEQVQDEAVKKEKAASPERVRDLAKSNENLRKSARDIVQDLKSSNPKLESALLPTEQEKQSMREGVQEAEEAAEKNKPASFIKAMSKNADALRKWEKRLEEQEKKFAERDMNKAMEGYRKVAFGLNKISRVWQETVLPRVKKLEYSGKKGYNDTAADISALKDSFRAQLNLLRQEVGKTGYLSNDAILALQQVAENFERLRKSLEARLYRSSDVQAKQLQWNLNQASLSLLKEMGDMKQQMMGMAQKSGKQKMGSAGKQQSDISEKMQKLGQKQSSKNGELSKAEKEYLKELGQRQQSVRETLEQLLKDETFRNSKEGKQAMQLLKKIQELESAMKTKQSSEQLAQLKKKSLALKEKFLKAEKSMKKRQESENKRQAEKVFSYRISPPPVQKDSQAVKEFYVPLSEELNKNEKIFFRYYMENLDNVGGE